MIDPSAVARAGGIRRRTVTMRPIFTTRAQAVTVYRQMRTVVDIWSDAWPAIAAAYVATVAPVTRDSIPEIDAIISATDQNSVRATISFSDWFRAWLAGFDQWHLERFVSSLSYATNVELSAPIISAPTEPDTLEAILRRNVALVRSVSDQTRDKIADAVFRGIQARTEVRTVAKEIAEATSLGRKRAMRIASDQTVKISATLDEQRQKEIGLTKFQWLHSGKVHFRPWHKARDGKVFDWDDPSIRDDKPGFAPFCGCKARGVIEVAEPVRPARERDIDREAQLAVEGR